jgi:hypothetical protein
MHHSSLQDWWHAGPSGLRRKRTQEGRVDIFWDALQRFFLDVGWLKMGTNGDPLERLELIRSLQNLFIILSLSATFSHFQPLSATFPPNQVSKIYRILRDRRFFEHVGCWSGLYVSHQGATTGECRNQYLDAWTLPGAVGYLATFPPGPAVLYIGTYFCWEDPQVFC